MVQLSVHLVIQPFGGVDRFLLNVLQGGTLIITLYINFGGLCMNYLLVSIIAEPSKKDELEAQISVIQASPSQSRVRANQPLFLHPY